MKIQRARRVVLGAGLCLACFFTPSQVSADDAKLEETKAKAAKGDAEAQYTLGMSYASGRDVPTDHEKAAKWLREAAEKDHRPAQFALGALPGGRFATKPVPNFPKDYAKAVKSLTKSAEQNDVMSQHDLGCLYAYGHGVPQDYVQAVKWWTLCANQGEEFGIFAIEQNRKKMTREQIAEGQKLAAEWKKAWETKNRSETNTTK